MSHAHRATGSTGAVWATRIFKGAASVTFALGVAIHAGRIVMGPEPFVRELFTPAVDIGFAVLILAAATAGLLIWPRYAGGRVGRAGYGFAMLVLIGSVPIHFRTLWTWSTDYMLIFPFWYSAIEVPMFLALSYMVTQMPFDTASRPAAPIAEMETP